MDDSSRGHQMLLLLLLASLFGRNTGAVAPLPQQLEQISLQERITALENRITLRDEELAKMLQLMLANQKEILRQLQQHPCTQTSYATDGTQQPRTAPFTNKIDFGFSFTPGNASVKSAAFQEVLNSESYPRSCREIEDGMSGEETIYPNAKLSAPGEPLEVYCDQDFEGGGWIVIQNRFDGFVNFNRSWEKYRDGFGDIGTEYWLGLDKIHRLTVAAPHEIAFVAESFRGERRSARYSLFEIGGETDRYRLQKLGVYTGTLGDEFTYNKGMEFSTYDQDHDQYADVNCALRTASGWWHRSCTRINLNGMYGNESGVRFAYWLDWLHLQGLKRTRIMIRRLLMSSAYSGR
ncbi:microfibril-associated glycoprotein 4-like [Anopheles marshallii]|uniref:microfibril-associated glycoprotein 4-like n=1 Tax=Anopheles marshallii TaxID=1521116 RepID=UPI00237B3E1A|nr:microfibril-associated glycoprotein 4-like [Anopheles marshallii]